jgi:hypothetical protein
MPVFVRSLTTAKIFQRCTTEFTTVTDLADDDFCHPVKTVQLQ